MCDGGAGGLGGDDSPPLPYARHVGEMAGESCGS